MIKSVIYRFLATTAILLTYSFIAFGIPNISEQVRRSAIATRIDEKVTIDGKNDEAFWSGIPANSGFIQYSPYNGKKPSQETEVWFAYDDHALYVFAQLYDKSDSITYRLSKRDEFNQCDFFGLNIDPFNDGQGSYAFFVTVAGVQLDARNNGMEDFQWDAVWHSNVNINDKGWGVEMAIPYSAIRFPKTNIQTWGINITRMIQRTREQHYWNFVDINVPGLNKQNGILTGIENVAPPIRLSVSPYLSSYINTFGKDIGYSIKGGIDLKYGITESFTLDMMLIPDFGQVTADREELNLGPYETYYNENRDFFKEGMELFNRGNIFHSRRIGGIPAKYFSITPDSNQIVIDNPNSTQLVNATKITGKTNRGLSLAFLNATTLPTIATFKDTITGQKSTKETQSTTNQNVTVIEQALPHNSYISLINTNLKRIDGYFANTTAFETLIERGGYHAVEATAAYSHRDIKSNPDGHLYKLKWSKIRGKFRYALSHRTESDTYNPNDMGFSFNSDKNVEEVSASYSQFTPSKYFLNWSTSVLYTYQTRYDFSQFKSQSINLAVFSTLKNHLSINFNGEITPRYSYDYDEPRVPNNKLKTPGSVNGFLWLSSDYRKKIALDINCGKWQSLYDDKSGYWYGISPRITISDNILIVYNFNQSIDFNVVGFVGCTIMGDSIFFGRHNYNKLLNGINTNYIVNKKSSISLAIDHNWTRVEYFDYHLLEDNGELTALPESVIFRNNINRNFFNVDLIYSWHFAPGSELSVVWKNSINSGSSDIDLTFQSNLNKMLLSEANNSLSIRLLYYLDYLYLNRKRG